MIVPTVFEGVFLRKLLYTFLKYLFTISRYSRSCMKPAGYFLLILSTFFISCSRQNGGDGTFKVGFVHMGSIHDNGYTQAMDKARLELESQGIPTMYEEHVPDNSDCEKAIRRLIKGGCSVIYTTSWGFMDSTVKLAREYPYVWFGHCSGNVKDPPPNFKNFFGRMYQSRYLAGIVAGLMTKRNRIGYVAAFSLPECIRGINAFTLGVKSVNKIARVEVVWTKTWYDPGLEEAGAKELLDKRCDIIAQHQDTPACQIAAEKAGALAIGYNMPSRNAAPGAYLTSCYFNWDKFILKDVDDIRKGNRTNEPWWGGLESRVVDLDQLSDLCYPWIKDRVDAARKSIVDGNFKVFEGPVYDQKGTLRVREGEILSDEEIWNMNWFVDGVVGNSY